MELMKVENKLPGSIAPFQLAVLILSLFVVASLFVELVFRLPQDILEILLYIDMLICVVFFIDFIQQLKNAPSKLEYMKWGWLDLISCIPLMEMNQFARVIRVVRLLRAIKSISTISHLISENKASSSLHFLIVISLMMMLFGSIYVLYLEKGMPGANIQSAADAFWWTFITITTVGYGDFYPVTAEGRVVAVVLIATGVGLFGSFTAVLASWILEPNEERRREDEMREEINNLTTEVQELKGLIKSQMNQTSGKPQ